MKQNISMLMTNFNRISSIDIMRGLLLFLMLFLNDLFIGTIPGWIRHSPDFLDGIGISSWIFPGFIFIAGVTIPFSISKRLSGGQLVPEISRHIFLRFTGLVIIGVLMLNINRPDAVLTGMSRNVWAILMISGVFLIWNEYDDKESNFFTITGLKLIGMAVLAFLVFKFKSAEPENNGSLILGSWGFPGIIGWGYLVCAFACLFFHDSIIKFSILALIFLLLSIFSASIHPPEIIQTLFGIVIKGNVPFIMLTGILTALIIKNHQLRDLWKISYLLGTGLFLLGAGFVLRMHSNLNDSAPWLIYSGISILIFTLLYFIADVKKYINWAGFVRVAGEHSLTAYLIANFIYYLIWITGVNIQFYKLSGNQLILFSGSLIWALLMVQLTAVLVRLNIKLKL